MTLYCIYKLRQNNKFYLNNLIKDERHAKFIWVGKQCTWRPGKAFQCPRRSSLWWSVFCSLPDRDCVAALGRGQLWDQMEVWAGCGTFEEHDMNLRVSLSSKFHVDWQLKYFYLLALSLLTRSPLVCKGLPFAVASSMTSNTPLRWGERRWPHTFEQQGCGELHVNQWSRGEANNA